MKAQCRQTFLQKLRIDQLIVIWETETVTLIKNFDDSLSGNGNGHFHVVSNRGSRLPAKQGLS